MRSFGTSSSLVVTIKILPSNAGGVGSVSWSGDLDLCHGMWPNNKKKTYEKFDVDYVVDYIFNITQILCSTLKISTTDMWPETVNKI